MRVILRYFPARGRVQPLRHALADAGIGYEDVRFPLTDWPKWRNDRAVAGIFASLPTLTWDDVTLAETLPIASFIARKLGHYEGLDDAASAELEAICSFCYVDVTTRMGELLWADIIYPGADPVTSAPGVLGRMLEKLGRLDARLPASGAWLGGERPVVADYFAAEALELVRYVLGEGREPGLRARLPRLFTHSEMMRARPLLAAEWARRPPNHSASPSEIAAIERLSAADLSSHGL